MDQKQVLILESKKDDKIFSFHIPLGAPYGAAYDACFEVLNEIVKMATEAAKKVEATKEEKPKEVK